MFLSHIAGCPFCTRILRQESFEADELCEVGEAYWMAIPEPERARGVMRESR